MTEKKWYNQAVCWIRTLRIVWGSFSWRVKDCGTGIYLHRKHSRRLKIGQGKTVAPTLFWERRELRWALSSSAITVTELDGIL